MRASWFLTLALLAAPACAQKPPEATMTPAYGHHGPAVLPNPSLTPGAVREGCIADPSGASHMVTEPSGAKIEDNICAPGFRTLPVRTTIINWGKLKLKTCTLYGLTAAQCDLRVEGDHLTSLELCGAPNSPRNVWPQPYEPEPGAKQKDVVENWLHKQVCAGKITLKDAQDQIRTDWYAVYLKVNGLPDPGGPVIATPPPPDIVPLDKK